MVGISGRGGWVISFGDKMAYDVSRGLTLAGERLRWGAVGCRGVQRGAEGRRGAQRGAEGRRGVQRCAEEGSGVQEGGFRGTTEQYGVHHLCTSVL